MIEMKRRIAGMMEFIGRTQVEMATEVPLIPASNTARSSNTPITKVPVIPPDDEQNPKGKGESQMAQRQQKILGAITADLNFDEFQNLSSLEMMETLMRNLMSWQGQFGKYGEK